MKDKTESQKYFRMLIAACQANDSVEVENLLKSGSVNIDEIDSNRRSAIFYCIDNEDLSCLSLLIQANADLDLKDKDGYSCLHLAVINGNINILEKLHKSNADLNIFDGEMHSLLHWAIVCGHIDILDYLLKNKCSTDTSDVHGAYPLHYAAQMCGHIDVWDENILRNPEKSLTILKTLIKHRVKIEVEDNDNRTPLIWASSSGSSEAVLELVNAGANPLKHEKDGLTALHCAASRGHLDCVKLLIDKCKVPIDIMDNNNCTPLFYSVTLGQVEVTEYLINMKANLTIQDCKGRTVFHCAAAKGQIETLSFLCSNDPIVWISNKRGDFPIHEAYYSRHMDSVYYMLNELKDINVIQTANTIDGRTLLHLAAAENDDAFCEKLLKYGARVNSLMKTSASTYLTPLDVAKLRNSKDCIELIMKSGGTTGMKVANKAAVKIQRNLKKLFDQSRQISTSKNKNIEIEKPKNIEGNTKTRDSSKNTSLEETNEKLKKSKNEKTSPRKKFVDKSAQTNLHLTTHLAASTASSVGKEGEQMFLTRSSSLESEKSQKSNSDVFIRKHRHRNHEKKGDSMKKKIQLKPVKNFLPPLSPHSITEETKTTKKQSSEPTFTKKSNKRYASEKRAGEHIHINKYDRFNSQPRDKDDTECLSTNTLSFETSTSLSASSSLSSIERLNISKLNKSESVHHHHFHCHHYCHHSRKKSRFNESDLGEKSNSKMRDELSKISNSRVETKSQINNLNVENGEETDINNNSNEENGDQLVKLIIKSAEPADISNPKSYQSLFDRQRLLLKSLYEIRRSRLNNRSIIINADLNNLLLKMYNFDIQKNCKSLKDLEKLLEILAAEISDEYRKHNKQSTSMLKINKKNGIINGQSNTSSTTAIPINGFRNNESVVYNKQTMKSRSLQCNKSKEEQQSDYIKQKKQQQLKMAYKPVLPNDIYKQYYDKNSKVTMTKFNSPRDKTMFLPVIRHKKQ